MQKKTLKFLLILLSFFLFIWIIVFIVYGLLFGLGSGVSLWSMLPFLVISLIQIVVFIYLILLIRKILAGETVSAFKDVTLANALIGVGIVYFMGKFAIIAINNLTGNNPGGWLQPVIAFFWSSILVIIGVLMKKK